MKRKNPTSRSVKQGLEADLLIISTLADIYKALKAISLYPQGHPLRSESLQVAHGSLLSFLNNSSQSLMVRPSGFTVDDNRLLSDVNPHVSSLAQELLTRDITQVTFRNDVSISDLQAFLTILSLEPVKIVVGGGVDLLLSNTGISTIWINKSDTSDPSIVASGQPTAGHPQHRKYSLSETVAQLDQEKDDGRYLRLTQLLIKSAEEYQHSKEVQCILPALSALLRHASDPNRNTQQQEHARITLDAICSGAMIDSLVDQLKSRDFNQHELIYQIIRTVGAKAAPIVIHHLCATDDLPSRKGLSIALKMIGPPAIASLMEMLDDGRWYVVRNMVSILGEIGSEESLPDLKKSAFHQDHRVRKETIRSLVKIGGKDAENVIIESLWDNDPSVVRLAIASLKSMKSRLAVQPLIQLVAQQDPLLRADALKREALRAVGHIGDHRATPHLLGLLKSRRWIAWQKWTALKFEAIAVLGRLGDAQALPELRMLAGQGGALGKACRDAIDNIERLSEESFE